MNPALDADTLRAALAGRVVGLDVALDVVARTGSTNADLLVAARAGAPDRTVLVAERQDRGRGRLDRTWVSPPGAGLTFSVLLRPDGVPSHRLGWLPLLTGLSVVRAIGALTAVPVTLKWPNDVLLGPGQAKCAGILAEAAGAAVVVGVGLNVTTAAADLPEGATSLSAEGAALDRAEVLAEVLSRLLADEQRWRAAAGDPDAVGLREGYRAACATLGRAVRVSLPGGSTLEATAVDVDRDGRLTLSGPPGTPPALAAGDVVHLRAVSP